MECEAWRLATGWTPTSGAPRIDPVGSGSSPRCRSSAVQDKRAEMFQLMVTQNCPPSSFCSTWLPTACRPFPNGEVGSGDSACCSVPCESTPETQLWRHRHDQATWQIKWTIAGRSCEPDTSLGSEYWKVKTKKKNLLQGDMAPSSAHVPCDVVQAVGLLIIRSNISCSAMPCRDCWISHTTTCFYI